MARSTRLDTRLLAALGACLAAGGGYTLPAQAGEPVKPIVQAPLRAQARAVAPRIVQGAALPQAATVAPDQIHAMSFLPLQPYNFEAEDWGDRPDLGMSVQEMSGWGSQWSGNKQIFWNPQPPSHAFQWDFTAPGGKLLKLNLTAAPDYANLTIRLGCYRQVGPNYYQLKAQRQFAFSGYAPSVTRRLVTFPLFLDPQCKTADLYRLTFIANQSAGRTFGGIDNIEVTK